MYQSLTPKVPTEFYITIYRSVINLNDNLFGFDFINREQKHGFVLEQNFGIEQNRDLNVRTSMIFQLSKTQYNYFR